MDDKNLANEAELREFAKKSIKKKRDAWQFLFVTVLVNAGLTVVWWINGPTANFWPAWVMFGMGIGVVAAFMDAYLSPFRGRISESEIDDEIKRMRGRGL